MKLSCHCGATIFDQTDSLPHKAHFIPDQQWFGLLDAMDAAVEKSGTSAKDREAACMKLRRLIGELSRSAWQCRGCGRVYVEDQSHEPQQLVPGSDDVPREVFRSRPS